MKPTSQHHRTVLSPVSAPAAGRTILTLEFGAGSGEARVFSRSQCFRLCADGTIRSGDNSMAAARVPGGWRVGRHVYRDFDCAGPVMLLLRRARPARTDGYGPCQSVRTINGQLYADDVGIGAFLVAGAEVAAHPWQEALLLPAPAA